MIIFSQNPTEHSRLANSLVWMSKIQRFLEFSGQTFCFPWAVENFGNYLEAESPWMMKNNAYNLYECHAKQELNAKNVSVLSRNIERNFEIQKELKAFDWNSIITFSEDFQCLYVSGNVDITDEKTIKLIKQYELTIIHEPFNLNYTNTILSKSDIKNIVPKKTLILEQLNFLNTHATDKRKVGLHIRRGDYERWEGGKYFFNDEFWLEKVKQLSDKDCYVFTNEVNPIFHNKLKSLGAYVSNESFEIDFVRMILMNEIHGPSSTFSGMAVHIAKDFFGYENQFIHLAPKVSI